MILTKKGKEYLMLLIKINLLETIKKDYLKILIMKLIYYIKLKTV